MAGRRIAIDCILTKKKFDGAQWCHCVRHTASETHLWDGKGYVNLIWMQIWLILICVDSNSDILSDFVYQIIGFAFLGAQAIEN